MKLYRQVAAYFSFRTKTLLFFCIQLLRIWSVLDILTWIKRDLEEKYISFGIPYCTKHIKLQVFIKFSYLGDHVLPTKLRSERCANDLNHFQLKVPSGTFSIAEIQSTRPVAVYYDIVVHVV